MENEKVDLIKAMTNEEKLIQLVDAPEDFISDIIYLIDYHLTTDISEVMDAKLKALKNRITTENETYIAEQIILILAIMPEEEIVIDSVQEEQ